MAVAHDDLQISLQGGVVQGRGHLTHTAAVDIHRLAPHVAGSGVEAVVRRGRAYGVVIAELVAAVEHRAGDVLGRLADVLDAAPCAADVGGAAGQHVPEQHLLQRRLADLGLLDLGGNGDFLSRLSLSHQLLGGVGVKGHLHRPLLHLIGGGVIGSVFRRGVSLGKGVEVHGLGLHHLIGAGHRLQRPGGQRRPQGIG